MTTINDVAKKAGVAKSTVSKVINNYPGVSEKSKQKVNEAIKELNFVPNQIAKSLSNKSINKIAVVIRTNYNAEEIDEVTLQYLRGIKDKADIEKYEIELFFARQLDKMNFDQVKRYFKSKLISGIIFLGLSKDDKILLKVLKDSEFYTCAIDTYIFNETTSSININNYQSQYEIANKYITKYDKKRILYLVGKQNSFVSKYREKAIDDLKKKLNIHVTKIVCDFEELKAYNEVLTNYNNHDMIIAASDSMVIGAKLALKKLNIFMPLVGFDGLKLLRYVGEDIPTVVQDFYKMSTLCVEELLRLMKNNNGRILESSYKIDYVKKLES